MIRPSWLAGVLAAVVLAVALFSAVRLAVTRRRRRPGEMDADGVHVLMGVAMAGMFVPRLSLLPVPAWQVLFAAGAGWFGWRAVQVRRFQEHCCRYPLPHLVDCAAMLYMLWAVPALGAAAAASGAGGMAGGTGGVGGVKLPVIGLVLALCVCGYVVWLGDRIQLFAVAGSPALATSPADGAPAVTGHQASHPLLAPRAATCCKIAMGVAMGVMLIDLL
jgi:hypothetical protein